MNWPVGQEPPLDQGRDRRFLTKEQTSSSSAKSPTTGKFNGYTLAATSTNRYLQPAKDNCTAKRCTTAVEAHSPGGAFGTITSDAHPGGGR